MSHCTESPVRVRIRHLRRLLLVHSNLYYLHDESLVTDSQWDKWANELVSLQQRYKYMCRFIEYHQTFKGFDGSTGYDLEWNDPDISRIARRLLEDGISSKKG